MLYIIREAQHREFLQDGRKLRNCMEREGTVTNSSKFYKLNVYLNESEILRCNIMSHFL